MKEIFLDFLEVSASMAVVIAVIALFSSEIPFESSKDILYFAGIAAPLFTGLKLPFSGISFSSALMNFCFAAAAISFMNSLIPLFIP